jgi:hypothetical protein
MKTKKPCDGRKNKSSGQGSLDHPHGHFTRLSLSLAVQFWDKYIGAPHSRPRISASDSKLQAAYRASSPPHRNCTSGSLEPLPTPGICSVTQDHFIRFHLWISGRRLGTDRAFPSRRPLPFLCKFPYPPPSNIQILHVMSLVKRE